MPTPLPGKKKSSNLIFITKAYYVSSTQMPTLMIALDFIFSIEPNLSNILTIVICTLEFTLSEGTKRCCANMRL